MNVKLFLDHTFSYLNAVGLQPFLRTYQIRTSNESLICDLENFFFIAIAAESQSMQVAELVQPVGACVAFFIFLLNAL